MLFLFEAGERPYEKQLTISCGLLSPDKTYLVSNVRLAQQNQPSRVLPSLEHENITARKVGDGIVLRDRVLGFICGISLP